MAGTISSLIRAIVDWVDENGLELHHIRVTMDKSGCDICIGWEPQEDSIGKQETVASFGRADTGDGNQNQEDGEDSQDQHTPKHPPRHVPQSVDELVLYAKQMYRLNKRDIVTMLNHSGEFNIRSIRHLDAHSLELAWDIIQGNIGK